MISQIIIYTAAFLLCGAYAHNKANIEEISAPHPDVGLKVPELVRKYGYPLEVHSVQTNDSYIVTAHRIPHGKNNANQTNKPVVFLMHGLLSCSSDWVVMGPSKGLGYILADLGYDVWMGNARGNTYSKNHTSLNPKKDHEYWLFSWHEIGFYDLPAMIDHALTVSNQEKLFYIGHSQGTTAFFVMTSMHPEYNEKIRLMSALGPAVFVDHAKSKMLQVLAKLSTEIGWVLKMLGQYELLPSTQFLQLIGQQFCHDHVPTQEICSNVLFLLCGYDSEQLNKTMLPVILSNTPAGAATKQLLHFGQSYNSGKFRQYNYGFLKNYRKYGSIHPPSYDLGKITAPVAIYYGLNDILINPKDVGRLHNELGHSVYKYEVPFSKFNHLDFIWAIDADILCYKKVIDIMSRY